MDVGAEDTVGLPDRRAPLIRSFLGPRAWRVNRHRVRVSAPPARVYDAALNVSLRDVPVVRLLFLLRGIPYRTDMTVREFFTTPPFRLVGEDAPREIVFAIERSEMRAVGNFQTGETFHPVGERPASILGTETWVESFTPRARLIFRLYWLMIGPFSGLIRRRLLAAAKKRAELSSSR